MESSNEPKRIFLGEFSKDDLLRKLCEINAEISEEDRLLIESKGADEKIKLFGPSSVSIDAQPSFDVPIPKCHWEQDCEGCPPHYVCE